MGRLPPETKRHLPKKLAERQVQPRIASASLRRMPDCYKIKLRSAGVRLVYKVVDREIMLLVLAIGKREGGDIYADAERELRDRDD